MCKRILVAEDDFAIRNLLLRVLGRAGFEIEAVTNGRDAIAGIAGAGYDVVVLDLMMPEASGFEVLAWVQREKPEVARKVVVVTAAADRDTRRIGEGTVFAIVRKPFDISELVAAVRNSSSATPPARYCRRPLSPPSPGGGAGRCPPGAACEAPSP